ncbi:MAG: 3'(2'),5'-bisphosphate nucleotidase CysQ [Bacteroidales bacterium]|jgi:3'(2'), 5'-bisphosphate nucleotidase|nr:3'(2'),5'-bisphosphate nucleotidase CysQ [Bacteroidales bacterium]
MENAELSGLLEIAVKAAIAGGKEILQVYGQDFAVEYKNDNSPLTLADRSAHDAIMRILEPSGLPVLSEEGKSIDFETRKHWDQFWLVDPLDGTKEFVKRNGEFTVNIALINGNQPVAGVILVPVTGILYFACKTMGALKIALKLSEYKSFDQIIKDSISLPENNGPENLTVVCSRSHMSAETEEYIDQLKQNHHDVDFVSIGSSLKLCLVAEGKAHIYPRFGPTMEWDTAAGHAIALCAGCSVRQTDSGDPVVYNKPDLKNPWFIVSRVK